MIPIKLILRLASLILLLGVFSLPLAADEPPPELLSYRAVKATDPGLAYPFGIAVDSNDNIYLSVLSPDWAQVFNQVGEKIGKLDSSGIGYLQNVLDSYTTGFTVGPDGRIYLSEHRFNQNQNSLVHIFNPDFTYQKSLPSRVDPDPEGNGYYAIEAIAVNSNNQLFVAYSDEVRIFDSLDLQHMDTLEISGSSMGIGPDDTLYIYNESIQKFSPEHTYLETFDFKSWYETNIGFFFDSFLHLDVLANGFIAVTMADPPQIYFFDSEFSHVGTIGTGERGYGNDQLNIFMYGDSVIVNNSVGEFLVLDSGNQRVQIFDSEFNYNRTLNNINPSYQFLLARQIKIGADDRVYVSGSDNNGIQIYSKDLEYITAIDRITTPGGFTGFSSFIDVDSDGRLYVITDDALLISNPDYSLSDTLNAADFGLDHNEMFLRHAEIGSDDKLYILNADKAFDGSGTIYVFNNELILESQFSTESVGIPHFPGSSLTGFAVGPDGKIYLAYTNEDLIVIINQERNGYSTLGGGPPGDDDIQFYRIYDITVDSENKVYVTDQGNNRIQVFSSDLEYLATIGGTFGDGLGQLALPFSVDVDENGWVYVMDTMNSRIQLFHPNTTPITEADTYNLTTNTTLNTTAANGVLANDSDPNNDPLTAIMVNYPEHAETFIFNPDGSFTYVPELDYSGADTFTYEASDGLLSSFETMVTINISEPPPTETPTDTVTATDTATETATDTETATATDTATETATATETVTDTSTATQQVTPEPTESVTPQVTESVTPQATDDMTPEPTAEATPIGTAEPGTEPPSAPKNLSVDPRQGRPQIGWSDDVQAEWFRIYIGNSDYSVHLLDAWIQRDEYCEDGICSVIPPVDPLAGTYHVWIQAWGYGEFSVGGDTLADGWSHVVFSLPNTPPSEIIGLTVTQDGDLALGWDAPDGATWYNVWLGTGAPDWTPAYFGWLGADDLHCGSGGLCSWEPITLPDGAYVWYIKAWGPGGFSTGGMVDAPGWSQGPDIQLTK